MTAAVSDPIRSTAAAPARGLAARAFGVVFSPRATYAEIERNPRVLGALAAIIVIGAVLTYAFASTDVGRRAIGRPTDLQHGVDRNGRDR